MADDNQYDLEEAIRLQKEAEAKVAGNARAEWRDGYTLHAEAFIKSKAPKQTFIGEDLRKYIAPKIGKAHHPNAWGAMGGQAIRRWMREGRIVVIGMTKMTSKASHARLSPLYEVQDAVPLVDRQG